MFLIVKNITLNRLNYKQLSLVLLNTKTITIPFFGLTDLRGPQKSRIAQTTFYVSE